MEWARCLGIPYLVMHPGSHMGEGEKRGLKRIAEALNRINDRTGDLKVVTLLETTAGQGTNLGYRFEHLSEILEHIEATDRMGICLDTCHAFAAGYDFGSRRRYRAFMKLFESTIGLDRLMLVHINDSKKLKGSRVDRHEHPGRGQMGIKAFSFLLNDPRFYHIPFLLETPKGKDENGMDMDTVNLNLLRDLIERAGNECQALPNLRRNAGFLMIKDSDWS